MPITAGFKGRASLSDRLPCLGSENGEGPEGQAIIRLHGQRHL